MGCMVTVSPMQRCYYNMCLNGGFLDKPGLASHSSYFPPLASKQIVSKQISNKLTKNAINHTNIKSGSASISIRTIPTVLWPLDRSTYDSQHPHSLFKNSGTFSQQTFYCRHAVIDNTFWSSITGHRGENHYPKSLSKFCIITSPTWSTTHSPSAPTAAESPSPAATVADGRELAKNTWKHCNVDITGKVISILNNSKQFQSWPASCPACDAIYKPNSKPGLQ